MKRASNTFSVLQATAAIVSLAIFFWSIGLPSLQFVEAANVTTFSDTLSDSAPGVVSDHTIVFTTPTGIANTETIVVNFSDGPFVLGSVDYTDVNVSTTSSLTVGPDCTSDDVSAVWTAGPILTVTFCAVGGKSVPANGTTTIQIGNGGNQLTNPSAASYAIGLAAGSVDTGETRVAIVANVTVTASVDTRFTFTVTGVGAGQQVNAETVGGTTTPTEIPFGTLTSGNASTAAQQLQVQTNASNGFVVTVTADSQLISGGGADIDGFANGNYDTVAAIWEAPANTIGQEETYGHWGITSDDNTLSSGNPYDVGGAEAKFVSASSTPVEVFSYDNVTDGTTNGEGFTRVGYKVEIGPFQEAAEDYQATLTYVATPIF